MELLGREQEGPFTDGCSRSLSKLTGQFK
ncbi:hypothetical protein ARTHRO9AX_30230 [Arthrobacter sp. 9AX]|nr:hypothetical protein ARTHRO9AX_30230 [Arthrobacter sp. 9AX]